VCVWRRKNSLEDSNLVSPQHQNQNQEDKFLAPKRNAAKKFFSLLISIVSNKPHPIHYSLSALVFLYKYIKKTNKKKSMAKLRE